MAEQKQETEQEPVTWRHKRRQLRQAQKEREARAYRRAVIKPDTPGGSDGTVENVIKADSEFELPGRLIVDWAAGCKKGGRYEGGAFADPEEKTETGAQAQA